MPSQLATEFQAEPAEFKDFGSMEKRMPFDEFWQVVDPSTHKDGPTYHSCCDSWSTRGWRRLNNNHTKTLQWRKVALLLDKSFEDKKLALLAKMNEEGWRLPVLLNKPCLYSSSIIFSIIKLQNIRK